ncbi:hypothetical protein D8674_041777 [Pyrus ussuriensis x Pyrus communis]|uniref:Uncharacterized protein n=1 Tax=Pyrus ussuriensis x Pyrus communis TaxID=2448454 RepID=A0A5N5I640_9ROSA|nr:hypothetical protein D8674_041777 [Pyrus ussuriensis x Pyrus communis]
MSLRCNQLHSHLAAELVKIEGNRGKGKVNIRWKGGLLDVTVVFVGAKKRKKWGEAYLQWCRRQRCRAYGTHMVVMVGKKFNTGEQGGRTARLRSTEAGLDVMVMAAAMVCAFL